MTVLFVIWNRSAALTVADVGHGMIDGWFIAGFSLVAGAGAAAAAGGGAFGCAQPATAGEVASAMTTSAREGLSQVEPIICRMRSSGGTPAGGRASDSLHKS